MEKTPIFDFEAAGAEPAPVGFADRFQSFVKNPFRTLLGEVEPVENKGSLVSLGATVKSRAVARQEGVEQFLRQVRSAAPQLGGRLIFSMDATSSREPTWQRACEIQADMFRSTASIGGLQVQLAYYRGLVEFSASEWLKEPDALLASMKSVRCQTGETQIRRILKHALKEHTARRVSAVVFVGDCVEENADVLIRLATEAGMVRLPIFVFQEGSDPKAKAVFEEIARLSGGAYCSFDASSGSQLKELLSAVAVYAAGGRKALVDYSQTRGGGAVRMLTSQVGTPFTGL